MNCFAGVHFSTLTIVVTILGSVLTALVTSLVLRDHSSKPALCGLDMSVDQRKLCDIVFVDHGQNWLFFVDVDFRVSHMVLVCRLEFTEAVVRDDASRLLLGLTVEGAEGLRHTCGTKSGNLGLVITFLQSKEFCKKKSKII